MSPNFEANVTLIPSLCPDSGPNAKLKVPLIISIFFIYESIGTYCQCTSNKDKNTLILLLSTYVTVPSQGETITFLFLFTLVF
jgi:hypothetical protein